MARVYPFMCEVVSKIFKNLLKKIDFLLPTSTPPKDVGKSGDPNYYKIGLSLIYEMEL